MLDCILRKVCGANPIYKHSPKFLLALLLLLVLVASATARRGDPEEASAYERIGSLLAIIYANCVKCMFNSSLNELRDGGIDRFGGSK